MRVFFIGLNLLVFSQIFAQVEKTSVWVLPFRQNVGVANAPFLHKCRGEIVEAFLEHGSFAVVDRDYSQLVENERELQKLEAFMDGKVVEQGKAAGASYIIDGEYLPAEKLLRLTVVDVATGNVVEKEERKIDPANPMGKRFASLVYRLANRWLGGNKMPVVRALENKGEEARLLLVAGGSLNGLKVDGSLEIFRLEKLEVEGETLERYLPIGEGKVERVENANFSNAKVKKGGKEIFRLLAAGEKLYTRSVAE